MLILLLLVVGISLSKTMETVGQASGVLNQHSETQLFTSEDGTIVDPTAREADMWAEAHTDEPVVGIVEDEPLKTVVEARRSEEGESTPSTSISETRGRPEVSVDERVLDQPELPPTPESIHEPRPPSEGSPAPQEGLSEELQREIQLSEAQLSEAQAELGPMLRELPEIEALVLKQKELQTYLDEAVDSLTRPDQLRSREEGLQAQLSLREQQHQATGSPAQSLVAPLQEQPPLDQQHSLQEQAKASPDQPPSQEQPLQEQPSQSQEEQSLQEQFLQEQFLQEQQDQEQSLQEQTPQSLQERSSQSQEEQSSPSLPPLPQALLDQPLLDRPLPEQLLSDPEQLREPPHHDLVFLQEQPEQVSQEQAAQQRLLNTVQGDKGEPEDNLGSETGELIDAQLHDSTTPSEVEQVDREAIPSPDVHSGRERESRYTDADSSGSEAVSLQSIETGVATTPLSDASLRDDVRKEMQQDQQHEKQQRLARITSRIAQLREQDEDRHARPAAAAASGAVDGANTLSEVSEEQRERCRLRLLDSAVVKRLTGAGAGGAQCDSSSTLRERTVAESFRQQAIEKQLQHDADKRAACQSIRSQCVHGGPNQDCTACDCKGGWAGKNCDSCELLCPPNALPDAICAKCRCVKGFAGDGKACEDVDECAAPVFPCDSRVPCSNLEGGFTCGACPVGYLGSGFVKCFPSRWVVAAGVSLLVMCTSLFLFLTRTDSAMPHKADAAVLVLGQEVRRTKLMNHVNGQTLANTPIPVVLPPDTLRQRIRQNNSGPVAAQAGLQAGLRAEAVSVTTAMPRLASATSQQNHVNHARAHAPVSQQEPQLQTSLSSGVGSAAQPVDGNPATLSDSGASDRSLRSSGSISGSVSGPSLSSSESSDTSSGMRLSFSGSQPEEYPLASSQPLPTASETEAGFGLTMSGRID